MMPCSCIHGHYGFATHAKYYLGKTFVDRVLLQVIAYKYVDEESYSLLGILLEKHPEIAMCMDLTSSTLLLVRWAKC